MMANGNGENGNNTAMKMFLCCLLFLHRYLWFIRFITTYFDIMCGTTTTEGNFSSFNKLSVSLQSSV